MKPRNFFVDRLSFQLAAAIAMMLATIPWAHAAALTWDADNVTAGAQDGAGTWTTSAGNWRNTTSSTDNVNWTAGDVATFGAGTDGTYTVTVGGDISVAGITFGNSGYTISAGSARVLTTTANISVASGKSATIGSNVKLTRSATNVLTGGGTLHVTGSGAILETTNIFGITDANLIVGTGGTLSATAGVTFNNTTASLQVTGGDVNITGPSANLALGATASVTSTATLTSGTITVGATNAGVRLSSNAGATGTFHLDGGILTAGRVFEGAAGGTTTFHFNGGTLKALSGTTNAAAFMATVDRANVRNGGAVIHSNGENITISQALLHSNIGGDLAIDGGLTKNGSGTLTLSGVSTYTGLTTVSAGTLALGASGSIDDTSGVHLGGGTFDMSAKAGGYSVDRLTGSGAVIGSLTVSTELAIGNSPGTVGFEDLTLGASSTFTYDLTGGASTADLGNVSGNLAIDPSAILDLVQLGTYTLNDKFTLFSYETGSLTGTFASLVDEATFTDAGGQWKINYDDSAAGLNGGTGTMFVTITAIPEPGAVLLGGLGLFTLLRRRRN